MSGSYVVEISFLKEIISIEIDAIYTNRYQPNRRDKSLCKLGSFE